MAQVAPFCENAKVGAGRGNEGGIRAATRELGIDRTEAQRSVKIAGLTPEAKQPTYEALHPETRHGNPAVSRQVGDTRERSEKDRFTAATAAATGHSAPKNRQLTSTIHHKPLIFRGLFLFI
ncbi:MAG: hypothetical protein B7Z77_08485 [Acidocella sp. 20-58-15]|nr:MAG: hypothetical protein B7Z77_08485 [Acidocella sp. 20-58-15]